MKIKELDKSTNPRGVRFYDPKTGTVGYWYSQWGYEDGKAGVWWKHRMNDSAVFPLFLDKLQDAGEFEVVDDKWKPPKKEKGKNASLRPVTADAWLFEENAREAK